ncbi:hypothetical protein FA13DRAFT_1714051 [Coprinellus micaceus]|uniref:J domain-containing protein n=1 Tax=Coprinellus micaceus TaxID=71717 RepID=A0A4Y7STN1_COPMI|nr:hypothetical protein FA13DRAFT_1714051 [Coprinellus micaceus]
MPAKKKNSAKKKAQAQNNNVSSSSAAASSSTVNNTVCGPIKQAERVKEEGNNSFKGGRYAEAIDLYAEAIELNAQEPSYWTNRAASYMALKKFKPAVDDCQQALFILNPQMPPNKPALGTHRPKPFNRKITVLQGHVKNFEKAYGQKDWGMARLALEKCQQALDAEGGGVDSIPAEWRVWKVELELARGNWDGASIGANEALRASPNSPDALALRGLVLFLTGKLSQALTHVNSALRYDPGHDRAGSLRKRVKDVERLKEEGNVAFKTNNLLEAMDKYGEALERIGKNEEEGKGGQIRATLLSNRATTMYKIGRHDDALQDCDESLELQPHSFKALRTRARIYIGLEKYDAAVADFKSAIKEANVRALKAELKKAELDLKRSKTKDYYKILGVEKECTEVEIKKAYRRESLKHHPDKGGDEEKFKLVSEAYAVLSDSQKRFRYDNGDDDDNGMGDEDGFGHMHGGMSHMDLAELFAQFHGGFPGAGRGGGRRGSGFGGMGGFPF